MVSRLSRFQPRDAKKAKPTRPPGRLIRTLLAAVPLAVGLVLAYPSEAKAYIDPSTGSYLLQWLLAGILGAFFAIRMYWRSIKDYFGRKFGGKKQNGGSE